MFRRSASAYALLAFPLAVLLLFTLIPTVLGIALSFFSWDGAASSRPVFIGLANYRALFADQKFAPALRNTLIFVLATVPITTLAAFVLASVIHARWFAGKAIIRTVFFMPTIISVVAVGFVWRWLLDDEGGLINHSLRSLGVDDPPNWLQDGHWPFTTIIVVSIWRGLGFALVLYLAALSNISQSLYEAAEIDGASRPAILRHITWPQVAPMTAFLLITGVIGSLQVFDIVFVMTAQTENDSTNVLNLYIYRQFTYGQYGYAASIGVVIFALTALATAAQLLYYRRAGVSA